VRLVYSEEELLREHPYARPQRACGRALHGGFDAEGRYRSPRTAVRWPAVRAWTAALEARGLGLLHADRSLLLAGSHPSYEQMKLMLEHGLGQGLWNSLTLTGEIEGRGRFLVDFRAPEFADVVHEDVSEMAVGHLGRGLLSAHEQLLLLLMNVLMVEIRAEKLFDFIERLLGDPETFADTREKAEQALDLVRRIRVDEEIHVAYLRTVLSELRGLTFRSREGPSVAGRRLVDPIWRALVHWHAIEMPRQARAQSRRALHEIIRTHPDPETAEAVLVAFRALEPPPVPAA